MVKKGSLRRGKNHNGAAPPPPSPPQARETSSRPPGFRELIKLASPASTSTINGGNFADIENNSTRYAFRSLKKNHDGQSTSKSYTFNKETKDLKELKFKQKIEELQTVNEDQNVKKKECSFSWNEDRNDKEKIKRYSSQKETKDGKELKFKEKKIWDVGTVTEDGNDKRKTESSLKETKDGKDLKFKQKKIGDVNIVNEDETDKRKTRRYSSRKEYKQNEIGGVSTVDEDQTDRRKKRSYSSQNGEELKSKRIMKIGDVNTDNEDLTDEEKPKKPKKRKREQIKDHRLDATLDLASGGSKKRGRGRPKKNIRSSRGGSRIQREGWTQLVRKPYSNLAITHPITHEAESADSPGSPSAGPSTSSRPSTFSASVAMPVGQGRDSRGRIIVSVSEFRQFVGGVPSPSRWFSRLLRRWKWNVCWKQFRNIDADTKNTWWTEFQAHYAWPGYSDDKARSVFYELMTSRYRDFIHDSKTRYYNEHKQPGYFPDDVWASFVAYWESDEALAASERAKRNRASVDGSGSKHTTGSISIAEHLNRMKREHGPDVDFSDVFASTHITVRDLAQPPQWIDAKAEAIYTQYRTAVEAEVAEGRLDHVGEKIPWCPQIWKEVASQGRKERGKRVYGFGDHGGKVILSSQSDLIQSHSMEQTYVADLESRVEQAERTNERILAENERILAENERILAENKRIKDDNDRILAQMRLLMETFQPGSSTCFPPAQD